MSHGARAMSCKKQKVEPQLLAQIALGAAQPVYFSEYGVLPRLKAINSKVGQPLWEARRILPILEVKKDPCAAQYEFRKQWAHSHSILFPEQRVPVLESGSVRTQSRLPHSQS